MATGDRGDPAGSGETDTEESVGSHACQGCREACSCSVHQVRETIEYAFTGYLITIPVATKVDSNRTVGLFASTPKI